MKKFRSNLWRLQEIRKAVTSRCETDLAEAIRSFEKAHAEHLEWRAVISSAAEDAQKQSLHSMPFRDCIAHRAWFQHLADCLCRSARECKSKEVEVESRREDLKKAMMEEKVVENLSKRERKEWLKQLHQSEQKEMDEAAAQCALRHIGPSFEDSIH